VVIENPCPTIELFSRITSEHVRTIHWVDMHAERENSVINSTFTSRTLSLVDNMIFVLAQKKSYIQEYDISTGFQVGYFEVSGNSGRDMICLKFGVSLGYLWIEYERTCRIFDLATRTLLLDDYEFEEGSEGFFLPGHFIDQEDRQTIFNILTGKTQVVNGENIHSSYSTPHFGVVLGLQRDGLEIYKKVYAIKDDKREIVCEKCGKSCENKELCGECFSHFYCSKKCQEEAWPTHMPNCNPIVLSQVLK
jgi:hypothetical protein